MENRYANSIDWTDRGLGISRQKADTIGICDNDECWGVWSSSGGKSKSHTSVNRQQGDTPGYCFRLTSVEPDIWPITFRLQLRLNLADPHSESIITAILAEFGANVVRIQYTPSGFRHSHWTALITLPRLREQIEAAYNLLVEKREVVDLEGEMTNNLKNIAAGITFKAMTYVMYALRSSSVQVYLHRLVALTEGRNMGNEEVVQYASKYAKYWREALFKDDFKGARDQFEGGESPLLFCPEPKDSYLYFRCLKATLSNLDDRPNQSEPLHWFQKFVLGIKPETQNDKLVDNFCSCVKSSRPKGEYIDNDNSQESEPRPAHLELGPRFKALREKIRGDNRGIVWDAKDEIQEEWENGQLIISDENLTDEAKEEFYSELIKVIEVSLMQFCPLDPRHLLGHGHRVPNASLRQLFSAVEEVPSDGVQSEDSITLNSFFKDSLKLHSLLERGYEGFLDEEDNADTPLKGVINKMKQNARQYICLAVDGRLMLDLLGMWSRVKLGAKLHRFSYRASDGILIPIAGGGGGAAIEPFKHKLPVRCFATFAPQDKVLRVFPPLTAQQNFSSCSSGERHRFRLEVNLKANWVSTSRSSPSFAKVTREIAQFLDAYGFSMWQVVSQGGRHKIINHYEHSGFPKRGKGKADNNPQLWIIEESESVLVRGLGDDLSKASGDPAVRLSDRMSARLKNLIEQLLCLNTERYRSKDVGTGSNDGFEVSVKFVPDTCYRLFISFRADSFWSTYKSRILQVCRDFGFEPLTMDEAKDNIESEVFRNMREADCLLQVLALNSQRDKAGEPGGLAWMDAEYALAKYVGLSRKRVVQTGVGITVGDWCEALKIGTKEDIASFCQPEEFLSVTLPGVLKKMYLELSE